MAQHDDATARAQLLDERARLAREIAELTRGDEAAFPADAEDTTDEPAGDEADQAESLEVDERNQAILAVLRDRLREIDAALARMNAGGAKS
jgi:RNA polymerase-binding transcription factor DksA